MSMLYSFVLFLGLHILLTYKYGSIKANSQIEGGHSASTIASLQQIGLRPSHTRQYHNRFQEIAFTRTDHTTINLVIRRAREVGDQSILHEVSIFFYFNHYHIIIFRQVFLRIAKLKLN